MGATSIAISRALDVSEPELVALLADEIEAGRVTLCEGYYAAAGHQAALDEDQRAFFAGLFDESRGVAAGPPPFARVFAEVRRSTIPGLAAAFETRLARGELVRIGDALYGLPELARIVARLEAYLRDNGSITPAQFRDLLGTSRKYALPLLEWFDARDITVRVGDKRCLGPGAHVPQR